MKATLYNKTKTYMFPSGKLATPDVVAAEYSATQRFMFVIYTDQDEEVIFQLETLSQACERYSIDAALSVEEKLHYINEKLNEPKTADSTISADEIQATSLASIAASMEYQNLLTLDDAEEA